MRRALEPGLPIAVLHYSLCTQRPGGAPIRDRLDQIFCGRISLSRFEELPGLCVNQGPNPEGLTANRSKSARIPMQINRHQTEVSPSTNEESGMLNKNQFRMSELPPGSALPVGEAAVFNIAGKFCATQARCTHRGGPLSEGHLDGSTVTCPWHGAQFNVCTGAVLRDPAADPLKTFPVVVEGESGCVEAF
ncbi:Rieske (2Fe-2S) protein [Occallatibacter riparius]|uniref:Rieske (2Fe-2S) protein n=1 Tax=Occallatibacter riparius TaxID=1002689 RepID=UPI0036F330D3